MMVLILYEEILYSDKLNQEPSTPGCRLPRVDFRRCKVTMIFAFLQAYMYEDVEDYKSTIPQQTDNQPITNKSQTGKSGLYMDV